MSSPHSTDAPLIQVVDLGPISYRSAWELQKRIFHLWIRWKILARKQGIPESDRSVPFPQVLFFCEHIPPVITLGKHARKEHLVVPEALLRQKGFEVVATDRGGDVTYHGPGQIVGYPILNLSFYQEDIHRYMRNLEEVIIRTLQEYGLPATRLPGATGVWLDPDNPARVRKICAMGVRISRWVTMHGFALNIHVNLHHFAYIVPCGIQDKGVTSLDWELGRRVAWKEIQEKIVVHFGTVFDSIMRWTTWKELQKQVQKAEEWLNGFARNTASSLSI